MMMPDLDKMRAFVADGLSPICASCAHFWRGRDEGLPGTKCTSPAPCGSPVAHLTFPHYDGPMEGMLHVICFKCGTQATHVLTVDQRHGSIGACEEHVRWAQGMEPAGHHKPLAVYVHGPDGETTLLSDYGRVVRSRPTLAESIDEALGLVSIGKKL